VPNVLTEKAGPLPVWAWMGIATVGILGFAALKSKNSSGSSAAQQQQLAAEEAALANAAGSAATSGNNSAGTYGSGYGSYGGNGYTGSTAGSYSPAPAASTTATSSATTSTGQTPQQFLAAFQATGQDAGQIVPGGTGLPTAPAPVSQSVAKTSTAPASAAWTNTYVVKAGDTLASIAAKYGISVATLAQNNVYVSGEVPGNKKVGQTLGTGAGLKTGQVLKVP
jgi:LysM repeat protein